MVPLVYRKKCPDNRGHLYLKWNSYKVMYTIEELKVLHSNFAHPSAKSFANLIKKASPDIFDPEVLSEFRKLQADALNDAHALLDRLDFE